jgi:hypothetical protein
LVDHLVERCGGQLLNAETAMSLSKLFLTKNDGTKLTVGPTSGDHIKITQSGPTKFVEVKIGAGVQTYGGTELQADAGSPQAYQQTPVVTVRFKDPMNNVYTYVVQNDQDRIEWSKLLGSPWITVWVSGTSHGFPAVYLDPDPSTPFGAA